VNSRFLLDSWAMLALVYEEKPASDRVEQLLHQAVDGEVHLFLSLINLGEIFYIVGARRGLAAAQKMVAYIKRLPIQFIAVDEERVLFAARFKATHRISYADAFAAAAAVEMEAVLLTGDPELLALDEELTLEALKRAAT